MVSHRKKYSEEMWAQLPCDEPDFAAHAEFESSHERLYTIRRATCSCVQCQRSAVTRIENPGHRSRMSFTKEFMIDMLFELIVQSGCTSNVYLSSFYFLSHRASGNPPQSDIPQGEPTKCRKLKNDSYRLMYDKTTLTASFDENS